MAQFKNISPLGALDIPALGRIVQAGEVFDVPADLADYIAGQPKNFEPYKPPKQTKATPPAAATVPPADATADVAPTGEGDTTPGDSETTTAPTGDDEKEGNDGDHAA
jgi:hypothetical protein